VLAWGRAIGRVASLFDLENHRVVVVRQTIRSQPKKRQENS
jgi:hypothetical protein